MMNRSLVLGLAAAVLVAVGLFLLLDQDAPTESTSGGALIPGLAQRVNDIDALDVVAPGGAVAVQLRREDDRWRVMERDGYEADFRQVVDLLRVLAEAQRAEPRTSNPELYSRLGVAGIGSADATGRRIEFPGSGLPAVIVGQVDPTGEGSYVRLAEEAQSWLADKVIETAADPVSWLEPSVMDIPAADLIRVDVRNPDGGRVRLQKAGDGGEWVLRDVPEGRSAGPAWQREALANGLRGLNLDDVRRFVPPHPEDASIAELVTADGLAFTANVWREGEEDDASAWVHFTVAEAPSTDADANDAAADESDSADETDRAERLASAVAVDARLSPWAFRIPAARADDLTPGLEDLLEPVDG